MIKNSKAIKNKVILITGGTGSFGKAFVKTLLDDHSPKAIRILSRDELKQWEMQNEFSKNPNFGKLRFFLGDVRDKDRLISAFEGVDIVIHAAALKQIPAAEYNPFECIKTNVFGAENVINAAFDAGVSKVIALSTDKAAAPINLYGATKLCSDKLFVAANNIRGAKDIAFSVVRYGNVMGSRGSVIPHFLNRRKEKSIPITHSEMTRFNILLHEATDLVFFALENALGGEIFVPKLPSYHINQLAEAIAPKSKIEIVGIRPGEKLHEEMITDNDSFNTIELKDHYVILPTSSFINTKKMHTKYQGKKVKIGFNYSSGNNTKWLTVDEIRRLIKKHIDPNFEL
jgi:UDP-N-acetylglucosamine 4,6-dehydratase/5-epimerase